MIYKNFRDIKLSALGMGCMRLPIIPNSSNDGEIDEIKNAEIIDIAIKNGINYFDTAWGYHNGQSEVVMGKLLEKYDRSSFYLATKFPGYDIGNMGKAKEIFEKQLSRCRTEYFDFYLIHNVCEKNYKHYLDDEKYGDFSFFREQKRRGRIKYLGFSAHASFEIFKEFLEHYESDIDFVQIQLNYLDWNFQDAKAKVELLNSKNIPIWVMEPVRGGKLANVEQKYIDKFKALRSDETAPSLAFRFLQTVEGVTMILSGMSNKAQLLENIKTFSEEKPLTDAEFVTLISIGDEMVGKKSLPCTACNYCVSYCPKGLSIPQMIKLYNEHNFTDNDFIAPMALQSMEKDKHPSACIGCKACEAVCPQQIKISDMMKELASV